MHKNITSFCMLGVLFEDLGALLSRECIGQPIDSSNSALNLNSQLEVL